MAGSRQVHSIHPPAESTAGRQVCRQGVGKPGVLKRQAASHLLPGTPVTTQQQSPITHYPLPPRQAGSVGQGWRQAGAQSLFQVAGGRRFSRHAWCRQWQPFGSMAKLPHHRPIHHHLVFHLTSPPPEGMSVAVLPAGPLGPGGGR